MSATGKAVRLRLEAFARPVSVSTGGRAVAIEDGQRSSKVAIESLDGGEESCAARSTAQLLQQERLIGSNSAFTVHCSSVPSFPLPVPVL